MALSLELVLKTLGGLACLGSISAGSWALVDKNSLTPLDREALAGGDGWSFAATPDTNPVITSGNPQELKITVKISKNGKSWECSIRGMTPEDTDSTATSKIKEQLDNLKSSIGASNGNWNPTSDSNKKSAEKFFGSCVGARTFGDWSGARWGGKAAKSTINLNIKKNENTTEYKFDEAAFKSLYTVAS